MPPRTVDAAQALEQRVGRAPHVQDHRQPGLAGQRQLRDVEALLPRAVQAGHEVVQPDLAHRHQARVVALRLQRLAQPLQVGVGGTVDVQRVDAQRIDQASWAWASARTASKSATSTAGSTSRATPAARARSTTASRSASNSAASRWQWVSIQIGMRDHARAQCQPARRRA